MIKKLKQKIQRLLNRDKTLYLKSKQHNHGLPPDISSWLSLTKFVYKSPDLRTAFLTKPGHYIGIQSLRDNNVYWNNVTFIKDQLIEELMDNIPQSHLIESEIPQYKIIKYIVDGEIK